MIPCRAGVKWVHARPFGGQYPDKPLATSGASLAAAEALLAERQRWQQDKPACQDYNAACKDWAAHGEVCTGVERAAGGLLTLLNGP